MYIRFVISRQNEDSRQFEGIFKAAYRLLDGATLDSAEWQLLRADVDWFVKNLPVPKHRPHPRAIFWFRSEATECTRRAWEMVQLLRLHGENVEMIKSRSPGRIVYFDGMQAAAIPSRRRAQ